MDEGPADATPGPTAAQPLRGVRVVDLTTNMSGPLATMVLADQGADVVKVEPPGGDGTRGIGTGSPGMSAYFANLNRGKRSVVIDLGTDQGRELVERLVEGADVFVQNFRPGVVERMGLGADALTAVHPRLVHASISGFGADGPLAGAPAYDHVVQAISGFAAIQSDGERPDMVRHGVIDKATAYATAQAITGALLARATTGRGARIEVSMLDVALAFLWPDGMMEHTCVEPEVVLPPVRRSFRLTPTADGYVSLVTATASQWERLVEAVLGGEDEPDLSDTAARMAGAAGTLRRVRARIATLPTAEVLDLLAAADVPGAAVVDLEAVADQPQVLARDSVPAFEHPVLGPVRQPRPAPRIDGAVPTMGAPAPRLGEHTGEVLAELGLDDAARATLREAGVVTSWEVR